MKHKNRIRPYVKILKEDRDYDWCFILPLLRKKLERMDKYFKQSQLIEGWKRMGEEIRLCIHLIDIINGDDQIYTYSDYDITKYVNVKNCKRFGVREDLVKSERKIARAIFQDELRQEKAWHLLWRLFELRMRTWWD